MTARKNLAGQRFGHLVALVATHHRGRVAWECRCDCGALCTPQSSSLVSGNTQSCGCFGRANSTAAVTTHGETGSVEHMAWKQAIGRCENPRKPNFPDYGGRGIRVCERWRSSFPNFLADMGRRPSRQHSLDRIDVNGDYSPDNCRWATPAQQSRNRRSNVWVELDGETLTCSDAAQRIGMSKATLSRRLKRGMEPREAMRPTQPR